MVGSKTTIALILGMLACVALVAHAGKPPMITENTPEQIRVEMTGDGRFFITYTTGSSADVLGRRPKGVPAPKGLTTNVYYGTRPESLTSVATGSSYVFTHLKYEATVHTVVLPRLSEGVTYYYMVGDKNAKGGVSDVKSFNTGFPKTWAIYGDFGVTNGVSLDALLEAAKRREFQGVFHVGDIAYDFHNAHGGRGDEFLNDLEDVTSSMPYHFCPGNHEKEGNFTHYSNRIPANRLLGQNSRSGTEFWYSFNIPYAHVVMIDTEVYHYFPDEAQQQRQLAWIKQDLDLANKNRDKQPWLIVMGHKCDWQDGVKFGDFRKLFHSAGVDLYICGHQHNYQRLFPGLQKKVQEYDNPNHIVDPKYWMQIVVGSPGCQEKISGGLAPYPNGIAAYYLSYGYGLMTVHNATHISWKYKQTHKGTVANGETEEDKVAIRKHYEAELMSTMQQGGDTTLLQKMLNMSLSGTETHVEDVQVKDEMVLVQRHHGPRA